MKRLFHFITTSQLAHIFPYFASQMALIEFFSIKNFPTTFCYLKEP